MDHKIAFFSELPFNGKTSRDNENMRTEFAWFAALDAYHFNINDNKDFGNHKFDIGIIIIPKNIDKICKSDILEKCRNICKKVGIMQEGPYWNYQDYSVDKQVWYFNALMNADFILVHNISDWKYFKGLTKKNCYIMPTLMIEDLIKDINIDKKRKGVMLGGNMCSWYGGFDSWIIAQEFNEKIYAPSMGRMKKGEDRLNIEHIGYATWFIWINILNNFKYGIHLMKTFAAGTFSLNCAYLGIPCIGYKGLYTQEKCYPDLSVDVGDLVSARRLAIKLRDDPDFYEECSKKAKKNYSLNYSEHIYIRHMNKIFNQIIGD